MIIPLGRGSLRSSSDLPGSRERAARLPTVLAEATLPYLVLLRVGFTLPSRLPGMRCALTLSSFTNRTISPLPQPPSEGRRRRYYFCGTFRTLADPSRYEAHYPAEFGLSSPYQHLQQVRYAAITCPARQYRTPSNDTPCPGIRTDNFSKQFHGNEIFCRDHI